MWCPPASRSTSGRNSPLSAASLNVTRARRCLPEGETELHPSGGLRTSCITSIRGGHSGRGSAVYATATIELVDESKVAVRIYGLKRANVPLVPTSDKCGHPATLRNRFSRLD
jgi:hypothetical protein